jgi:UPF0755 protein
LKRLIRVFLLIVIIFSSGGGYYFWKIYYRPNIHTKSQQSEFIYISTGTTMPELIMQLQAMKLIEDTSSFNIIANLKNFRKPKAGKYRIKDKMTNRDLINMLRSGNQEPIQFSFNNIRTKAQLASRVGGKFEADSAQFLMLLNNPEFLAKYGLTTENIMSLFIPNTYNMLWNTSEEQFFDRMKIEYTTFWNGKRKAKAKEIQLTQSEVTILASIVEEEQQRFVDERPTIAGLYINRIRKGMKLEADPTLKFAIGNFKIARLLNVDKQIKSPYNTYLYAGLPPGPIRIPEIASIDAVLNYKKSNYIFMCGNFGTGRNNFTSDYNEHLRNARAYQNALDKASIKR